MMMALAAQPRSALRARARRRDAACRSTARMPAACRRSACASRTAISRSSRRRISGAAACASPGGGCQFLGTAATAQVVGEALGLSLGHSALVAVGPADLARHGAPLGARPDGAAAARDQTSATSSPRPPLNNAMVTHAAFGGSTNLLLHVPAIAHAAGLPRPTADDWARISRSVPRLVDALPNGPRNHPTVQVFLAGGVPEVMLHLRRAGLLRRRRARPPAASRSASSSTRGSPPSAAPRLRQRLRDLDGVDPDDVIMSPERGGSARPDVAPCASRPATSRPTGAVIKSTAIDPSVVDAGRRLSHHRPGEGVRHRAGGDRRDQGRGGSRRATCWC